MTTYLRIYSKFFGKRKENPSTKETNQDTNQDKKIYHVPEQHGLNPFNDPEFRPYFKDYTNLTKEYNRRLVAEFILDRLKSDILEWCCFGGHILVPHPEHDSVKDLNGCDLSTIGESSHCEEHCFCPTSKQPEKYLNHYHSDGILERFHHQDVIENSDHPNQNLTQSLNSRFPLVREKSSSLTDLDMIGKEKISLKALIKKESEELSMEVKAVDNGESRLLLGAVNDDVIYLSKSQINLFHYLISTHILEYLNENWNEIQERYRLS